MKRGVFHPLLFLHRVRDRERQPGENEQRYAVSRKIKTFPRCSSSQQNTAWVSHKLRHRVSAVPAQSQHRIGQVPLFQPFTHSGHGRVGGKQPQSVAVSCVQQLDDLFCKVVIVIAVSLDRRHLGQVQQAVPLVVEGRGCDMLPHSPLGQQASFLFEPPEVAAHCQRAGSQYHGPVLLP